MLTCLQLQNFSSKLCARTHKLFVLPTSFMVPLMGLPQGSGVKLIFSIAIEIVISAQNYSTSVMLQQSSAETHHTYTYISLK